MKNLEIQYQEIEQNKTYETIIKQVIDKCFETENLKNLYISITLTTPENIRKINNKYRKIDKPTDVLSFPMFEKEEIDLVCKESFEGIREALGDVIISVEQVKKQAKEYEHSFERELAYMVVHGFYHLMGYDHMQEDEKNQMRAKEENILTQLDINR